jgi:hypothetical protein
MNTHKFFGKCSEKIAKTVFYGLILVIFGACANGTLQKSYIELSPEDQAIQYKFRGIYGGVLYFNASGSNKENITIYNEKGVFWRSELQIGRGARKSTYTDAIYLPKEIRVEWRTDYKSGTRGKPNSRGRPDGTNLGWEGGTVLGDYTVPLATRIPDEVLDYIRANGGALRVKVRLKDNGVAVGWDVERRVPIPNLPAGYTGAKNGIEYVMAGGDFREAQIYNGKVTDPGWEN